MRLQERPRSSSSAGVAVRRLRGRRRGGARRSRRAGLYPSNCRLLDPARRRSRRAPRGRARRCSCSGSSRPTIPSTPWMETALSSSCRDHGGGAATPGRAVEADGEGRRSARGGRRSCARRTCATSFVACGHHQRHLRDGDHVGPLPRVPRSRDGRRPRRRAGRGSVCRRPGSPASRAGSRTSIRTARRPTSPCSRPAARGGELEQWDEIKAARVGGGDRGRRHDHPPPRRRPRPPPLVRPPAPGAVRGGAGRREGGPRPAGVLNPGVLIDPTR